VSCTSSFFKRERTSRVDDGIGSITDQFAGIERGKQRVRVNLSLISAIVTIRWFGRKRTTPNAEVKSDVKEGIGCNDNLQEML